MRKKMLMGFVSVFFILTTLDVKEANIVSADERKWNFDYTGAHQTFTAPEAGFYQLETWGAEGDQGGKGGYANGKIFLKKNEQIMLYVGGVGTAPLGGFNGGGNGGASFGKFGSGGGGATDIRFKGTALGNRILVAGGGGGGGARTSVGHGGGLVGEGGHRYGTSPYTENGFGGDQTAGGRYADSNDSIGTLPTSGGIGVGGNGGTGAVSNQFNYNAGGGGGGYYGGGGGAGSGAWLGILGGGGGGSSYIGGVSDGFTIAGSKNMPNPSGGSVQGKSGHGYARVTLLKEYQETTEQKWNFDFTGEVQTFTAPTSGFYNLEAWGARGGSDVQFGGKGGYATGAIYLEKNEVVQIYVGGKGTDSALNATGGGFNGGGNAGAYGSSGGGGGATDFRLRGSELEKRVLVAGGGGGASSGSSGGDGGGLTGLSGAFNGGSGGAQYAGGAGSEAGTLGKGGDKLPYDFNNNGVIDLQEDDGAGGGGGYYGGGAGYYDNLNGGGGGGSSYIGGVSDGIIIAGNITMPSPSGESVQGNNGNGFARVTLLKKREERIIKKWNFDYTGTVQTFTAPTSGFYQLESWGAQGSIGSEDGLLGGEGGYAKGNIYLQKGEQVYVYVGGVGEINLIGGWNGGGGTDVASPGGGGATDFRMFSDGNWKNYLDSRILVAGGGGGGDWGHGHGGAGGGLIGQDGTISNNGPIPGKGATQTTGGSGEAVHGTFGSGGVAYGIDGGGGGGGGYYGGGTALGVSGGGGGSSYIGGVSDGITIAGNTMLPNPNGGTMQGKNGHGFASVTLLEYVDNDKPLGSLSLSTNELTNNSVVITAVGSDTDSGFKHIILPSGTIVTNSVATFQVNSNGTYSFVFEDNAGNTNIQAITVSNIDKEAPIITFTPENIAGDIKDLKVQVNIQDVGVSGYKQYRYIWTKEKTYPTESWSEWDATENPIIIQDTVGAWMLHIEAEDHAGNIAYAMSGTYEKIMMSGPSVNISVSPTPTGTWVSQPIDAYVMESGDAEMLAKASKLYEVTNSSLYPSNFTKTIPVDKKVQLDLLGENFVHVQYVLDDGTKIVSTAGPYLIDTGTMGDFEMKLQQEDDTAVTTWSGKRLHLVITNPANSSISGYQKQYRIEGLHQDWQVYKEDMVIDLEGKHRIYGRIINQAGEVSEQKWVQAMIDKNPPTINHMRLEANEVGMYDVTVSVNDGLSGVKEVVLNSGTTLTAKGNNFTLNGSTTKPLSLTVKDNAGNITAIMEFAKEPVIEFQSPYELTMPMYRQDVVATLRDATSYTVGRKSESCNEANCTLMIQTNTKITAINEDGVKETRKTIAINNLDKSKILLALNGKRKVVNPLEIDFAWNYTLDSGELICTFGSTKETYPINGKTYGFTGINANYDCYIEGVYAGELVKSNHVMIFADHALPGNGGSLEEIPKMFNVYVDEGSSGDAYMINAKSDNYKHATFPFPKGAIE